MEFFPSPYEIWVIAKASWPLGVLLFIGFFLQDILHYFFEWLNKPNSLLKNLRKGPVGSRGRGGIAL